MTKVAFFDGPDGAMAFLAASLASVRKPAGVDVFAVGGGPGEIHPLIRRVLSEAGAEADGIRRVEVSGLYAERPHVVIAVTREGWDACPLLPGRPALVNWNLEKPCAGLKDEAELLECLRRSRDEILRLVGDFFDRGYLAALTDAESAAELVIESISDGIIAHDLQRRIIYFNDAAEKITGYKRSEALGRDCHDVFPGRFCGGKCKFCGTTAPLPEIVREEITIATRDGERRQVDMTLTPMSDWRGRPAGVLVTFRDITRQCELERRTGAVTHFSGIIGRDRRMLEIYDLIRDLAESNVPVLISGESGTGKELVAMAIHNEGPRADRQFVPVNCGALPETLLESELFGHVKGAFTGAVRDKKGRFELADGGTIFLDEIGDISPAMQVRLMRVLQEGTFERVGSEQTIKVNVRVISATNKDLQKEIAAGRFREDLYYRLSVVPLHLPPLRERKTDIPLLVDHLLKRIMEETGRQGMTVSADAMDVLLSYDWPGNVRQLQNWLQFAMIKCKGTLIQPEHLPKPSAAAAAAQGIASVAAPRRKRKLDAQSVKDAIARAGGSRVEAAKLLGISRATLYRFLSKLEGEGVS